MKRPEPLFRLAGLLLMTAVLISFAARSVTAQEEIAIQFNEAKVRSLYAVEFTVSASSDENIERVNLHYGTESRTCQTGGGLVSMDFFPAQFVNLKWEWPLTQSGALPLGTEIWWQWELINSAGSSIRTDRQTITFDPERHDWIQLSRDVVTVRWYSGSQGFGRNLLDIAVRGLDRLEEITGFRPDDEIQIVVYPTTEEVRQVLISTYEWTGGVAIPEYNTTIIGVGSDEIAWAEQVIPHELAHLVVGMMSFNCQGVELPTWLHEGLAEYTEGPLAEWRQRDLIRALENEQLPPLRALAGGFSAYSNSASLSYSHSGAVVSFLVRAYGPENLTAMIAQMQSGTAIDPAMDEVYGFDTNGLDGRWRESLGFDPVPFGQEPVDRPRFDPASIPTLALWTPAFGATATPSPAPSETPSPTRTLVPIRTAQPAIPSPTPSSEPAGPWGLSSPMLLVIVVPAGALLALAAAYFFLKKGP